MNLDPIVGNELPSIWVFFIITIPLTIVSLYVVLKRPEMGFSVRSLEELPVEDAILLFSGNPPGKEVLMTKGKVPNRLP